MNTQVFDQKGQPLPLGRELGRGGEGAVYEVANDPRRVAKIYHQPAPDAKGRKLRLMSTLATTDVLAVAAWPVSTIYRSPGGPVVGCVQPRAKGREIHELFGPSNRAQAFPKADWRFLTHVAMNCAAAFSAIHGRGHVIGDVNTKNVWVTEQATVSLVDCDSFQIISGNERFLCEVGVDNFTPPELQGISFRTVQRTQNHDCFGLAILMFHLLFMGRHPFVGRFLGAGDMPVERSIKEYRFAFGRNAPKFQMSPPPFVPPMQAVSPEIQTLFEQAFGQDSSRPDARPKADTWRTALLTFEKQLRKCPNDAGHAYYSSNATCPWCEVMRTGGPSFFISVSIAQGAARIFEVDAREVSLLIGRIEALVVPLAIPSIRQMRAPAPTPLSEDAAYTVATSRVVGWIGIGSLVATVAACGTFLALPVGAASALLAITFALACVFWGWYLYLRVTSPYGREMRARHQRRRDAVSEFTRLQEQLEQCATSFAVEVSTSKSEVAALQRRLVDLKPAYEQKRRELEQNRRTTQLKDFLSGHYIQKANIAKVPKTIVVSLISFNIETADDITESALLEVPGIGPARASALVAWRREIEQRFRFDPAKGVSQSDLMNLLVDFERKRQSLKHDIGSHLESLSGLRNSTQAQLASLRDLVERASETLAQAEADCRAAIQG